MVEIEALLALLAAVALLATLSRRIGVPYPILMVLGGLVLGAVPGVPHIELTPELVLLLFLPPILFAAAFFTSVRELRENARPIGLLAFGLVLTTTAGVAVVAQWLVPEMGWPAAFALGAIVSPPDAIAATAIAQRVGLPRRMVVILEGESLVNDATALVAYRFAVVAAVTGAFSLSDAALRLPIVALGGVGIGLAVGAVMTWIARRINDPPVEVLVSLIGPFAAYLPAEQLGVSGVLAVVSAGILFGRHAPRVLTSSSRVLGSAVWEMVIFLINGLAFVLIGLQLPVILDVGARSLAEFAVIGLAVSVAVVLIRFAWVFPATYLPRLLIPGVRRRDPYPHWHNVVVLAYAGMRGSVSLAAALALPFDFPERDLILFITFCVILTTLVAQGLSLPWLVRRLGIAPDAGPDDEEAYARQVATEAAIARLDGLATEWPTHRELVDQLRSRYAHREQHAPGGEEHDEAADQELLEHRAIRQEVIQAERLSVIELRDRGEITDDVLRRLERELDLEELRMEA